MPQIDPGTESDEVSPKGIPIRSISRALKIIQIINRAGSISMMEIARKSELPYPSACRIVQTLVHEGMIEREPARKNYRPAPPVQSLSYGYQDENELVRLARPFIVELTNQLGWPVSIVTRVGNQMILRDSTHALTSLTFASYYPGYSLPIAYSADGKAFLAALPQDELDLIAKNLGPRQPTPGDPNCLLDPLEDLTEIREQGYAIVERVPHTITPGRTSCISMPLFRQGRVIGAVTIAYFATTLNRDSARESLLQPLKDTQQKINEVLAVATA
ncbi:IclR family transcriptional regulator [Hyphomonas johnsonii]|uniref:IclR family transcriptional regulator n=1 Tax=Hyphomonas johnsonii MHS-2 TaxID=1280950 RepID=A0A059FGB7_9PROT|nr:IclR family transcriptional regulator [Hyphomonas johnsonii]KCZ89523.1 IclR family transcriptional regulator [Hyphomonas johnsonii MHS-2]